MRTIYKLGNAANLESVGKVAPLCMTVLHDFTDFPYTLLESVKIYG